MQKKLLKKLAECHKLAIQRALSYDGLTLSIDSYIGEISLHWKEKGVDVQSEFYSISLSHPLYCKGKMIERFYKHQIEIADHWLSILKEKK